MKKFRQKVRAEEPAMIGFSGGTYVAPEPRVSAFIWGDERDLDVVLTEAKSAA
ncbi:MAG: hypothetical protein ABI877_04250 [Gemmatimonadaceae bacterium]